MQFAFHFTLKKIKVWFFFSYLLGQKNIFFLSYILGRMEHFTSIHINKFLFLFFLFNEYLFILLTTFKFSLFMMRSTTTHILKVCYITITSKLRTYAYHVCARFCYFSRFYMYSLVSIDSSRLYNGLSLIRYLCKIISLSVH